MKIIHKVQGERRFWRVCMKWLAKTKPEIARRNLIHTALFGRWDDLLVFIGTPLQNDALSILKGQLELDVQCKAPSLLAKWLPSENTSSAKTRSQARVVRHYFNMTAKQYRKTLSILRARINVLERLMSENRWDEIDFSKIPSKAGLKYKNAFARHDIERMKKNPEVKSYAEFAKDTETKVNAKVLYPYEVVAKAIEVMGYGGGWYGRRSGVAMDDTNRLMTNKYWDNLEDYFNDKVFNGMCIVDVSGSMCGSEASAPINVAISLGLYCAEKAKGPYHGHFITFSSTPKLVATEGVDFCDKVQRMSGAEWGGSTNVEAAFDLMLDVAVKNHLSQSDIPENLLVISDMEFNHCVTSNAYRGSWGGGGVNETLFETMEKKWRAHGYDLPKLVFWNVQARQNNIPMRDNGYVSYVSGMSPVIFDMVMSGKTGYDLMMDKLDSPRYEVIH